jgi:hypothetical protein
MVTVLSTVSIDSRSRKSLAGVAAAASQQTPAQVLGRRRVKRGQQLQQGAKLRAVQAP